MRASYKSAVAWIAANDDTEWLKDDEPFMSVTGALVCDLFNKEPGELINDIRKELKRKGY